MAAPNTNLRVKKKFLWSWQSNTRKPWNSHCGTKEKPQYSSHVQWKLPFKRKYNLCVKVIPEEGEKHPQRWVFEARFVLWQAEEKNYSALVPWAFLICKQFHTIFRIKVYLINSINWAGIFYIPRHATHLFMNTVFEAFCCTFDSQLRSRKT